MSSLFNVLKNETVKTVSKKHLTENRISSINKSIRPILTELSNFKESHIILIKELNRQNKEIRVQKDTINQLLSEIKNIKLSTTNRKEVAKNSEFERYKNFKTEINKNMENNIATHIQPLLESIIDLKKSITNNNQTTHENCESHNEEIHTSEDTHHIQQITANNADKTINTTTIAAIQTSTSNKSNSRDITSKTDTSKDEDNYILLKANPKKTEYITTEILRKETKFNTTKTKKQIVKDKIAQIIESTQITPGELKLWIVDKKRYCSKATFYRHISDMQKQRIIQTVVINGKAYLVKTHTHPTDEINI